MEMLNAKNGMDVREEVGKSEKETKDFDPDKRIGCHNEKLDQNEKKETKDFDPDKKIEAPKYYTSEKERIDRTPSENSDLGTWKGKRADSEFIPSEKTRRGQEAKEKLAEKGLYGIEYKNGEPDFSKVAEETVIIDNMTENRWDYHDKNGEKQDGNYAQADKKLAEQWTKQGKLKDDGTSEWREKDVKEWRDEHKYTWHECCDREIMHLISRTVHKYFLHSGGCAECRIRDSKNIGGIFDE